MALDLLASGGESCLHSDPHCYQWPWWCCQTRLSEPVPLSNLARWLPRPNFKKVPGLNTDSNDEPGLGEVNKKTWYRTSSIPGADVFRIHWAGIWKSNLKQLDLIKCRRMDGRHPAVAVRDAVCFSLKLIELPTYPVEPLQLSRSSTHAIYEIPPT